MECLHELDGSYYHFSESDHDFIISTKDLEEVDKASCE
jgi:hypothetical protein